MAGDGQVIDGPDHPQADRQEDPARSIKARSWPVSPAPPPTLSPSSPGSRTSSKSTGAISCRAAIELAKDWRLDKALRQLEALLIVADKDSSFLISGTGDVDRAGRRHHRHRLGRALRPGRGPGADPAHRPLRQGHRPRVDARSPPASASTRTTKSPSRSCECPSRLPEGFDLSPTTPQDENRADAAGDRRPSSISTSSARSRPRRPWPSPSATATGGAKLPPELADEIAPKNILMIGPTGVGKTEISRRLAKLTSSPFLKIEASKFTEVGYVGRDVESMIRDLVRIAVDMVKQEKIEEIRDKAESQRRGETPRPAAAADRDARTAPPSEEEYQPFPGDAGEVPQAAPRRAARGPHGRDRGQGKDRPRRSRSSPTRGSRTSASRSRRSCPASWAASPRSARSRSERPASSCWKKRRSAWSTWTRWPAWPSSASSIRASSSSTRWTRSPAGRPGHGPEVSREGVQRDLLPIVEGTTVNTRYGLVKTDHVLFIGAGAFHRGQALRPHPRAPGPLPDPGRARPRSTRRISSAS